MSDQTTRRSLIAGAAALPALAIPAVAATRDPAVDAVQHLKLTAEATYRLVRGLDEAEGDACEQHGHRPIPLVQWRNYDISGSEIDQRRTALLADGGDTRQIEAEYQDAKAREKELIKAGEEWDAEVRITSLRERTEAAERSRGSSGANTTDYRSRRSRASRCHNRGAGDIRHRSRLDGPHACKYQCRTAPYGRRRVDSARTEQRAGRHPLAPRIHDQ